MTFRLRSLEARDNRAGDAPSSVELRWQTNFGLDKAVTTPVRFFV
jgi:hypothetical protein